MPEGAVSVTRPGYFGNPFPVDIYGLELSLALFRNTARGIWDPQLQYRYVLSSVQWDVLYKLHDRWIKRLGHHPSEMIRAYLHGKDLACWCPLVDKDGDPVPCHADVLLEVANAVSENMG